MLRQLRANILLRKVHLSVNQVEQNGLSIARIAAELRGRVVTMSHKAKAPHLGSCLSSADIVAAAYWGFLNIDPEQPDMPGRDRFILSKGHAAALLYGALAMRGYYPIKDLDEYNTEGSLMIEHPGYRARPGIELATGSLGHGLPCGLGMAMAAKIQNQAHRIFVLMSDGECNEGSVWEAAMMAPAHNVSNLCAMVDFNKWQATGRSQETLALEPFAEKWRAFGWEVYDVDGHDIGAMIDAAATTGQGNAPKVIICRTIKGKGVSFMEDDNNWHYKIPTANEVDAAKQELGLT